MRQYGSFFRIRFLAGLQYRAAAWAGISTQFAWGGLTLLLYAAFHRSGSANFPMTFSQLSSYIWLQQALLALFMSWYFDNEILESVSTGGVAYELCRPCDLYTMWFVKNLAVRLSRASLRCAPILLVAAFLPAPFRLSAPANWEAALLFPLSLALGLLVIVSFSMLIYISSFYTISTLGIRVLSSSVVEFFSGAVIPLPFFPEQLQAVINLLPFASIQSTPFLIYTGHLAGQQALQSVAVQLLWLAGLLVLGRALMGRALKKVVVQGG